MNVNVDYFLVLEALGEGVIVIDEENRLDYINRKAIEIIEKEPEHKEKISNFLSIRTDEKGQIIESIISLVKRNGLTRGLEKGAYIEVPVKGKRFISASITRIEKGMKFQIVLIIRDITNLIRLENANMEQKKNLEMINNALPLGLLVLNTKQKVIHINQYIINMFHVTDYNKGDFSLGDLLKCANAKDNSCGFSNNCGGCQIRNSIMQLNNEEQSYKKINVTFKHFLNGMDSNKIYQIGFVKIRKNEELELLVILQDITEQVNHEEAIKKAKDDAVEAYRVKSEFLANMSHEIRTPLNGIIGMIDLTRCKLENEELIENLDIAKSSSVNLLNIINDILDISKIEAGKLVLSKNPFLLDELFDEIMRENKYKADVKKIKLNIIKKTLFNGNVLSDKVRIKQVLINLVENAIKFTDSGEVSVYYELVNNNDISELSVHVIDTGIGISTAFHESIFDSFTQVDGSYTRKKGGTGLGLAISKSIVTQLGGYLGVKSEEGVGSDFYFHIPIDFENEKVSFIQNRDLCNEDQTKVFTEKEITDWKQTGRILVVEDDLVNQRIIKTQLESNGHMVDIAANGKVAIEKLATYGEYDMIFMDIQMPVMSGLDATDIIRKDDRRKQIPIIALTALALKEDMEKILKHDFDGYITKPIDYSNLNKVVKRILQGEKIRLVDCFTEESQLNNIPKVLVKQKIVLNKHIESMKNLYIEQAYEALEEKAQMLCDHYSLMQKEDERLMTFKLIMSIRQENWENCKKLLDKIESQISE